MGARGGTMEKYHGDVLMRRQEKKCETKPFYLRNILSMISCC